jgi:flagellar motor switch protein FliN/FliY
MADTNLVELSFLENIAIELVVELGRTQMTVRELAALEKDDVIELNRLVTQPLLIRTGDQVVAKGEVFLEGERVCLRVAQVLTPSRERIAESA